MSGSYQMKIVSADTRLRPDHNTEMAYIGLIPAGVVLTGAELFIAPVDRGAQKKGDVWLKTTYGGKTGWVAQIHAGGFICNDFRVLVLPVSDPLPPVEIKPVINLSQTFTAEGYPPLIVEKQWTPE